MWDLIAAHVRAGKTAGETCDLIYMHLGPNLSVTQLINAARTAKANNAIPVALRI